VHVIPTRSMADLNFANAESDPDEEVMDDAARRLREALVAAGHGEADVG
jgi:hypothetical protein